MSVGRLRYLEFAEQSTKQEGPAQRERAPEPAEGHSSLHLSIHQFHMRKLRSLTEPPERGKENTPQDLQLGIVCVPTTKKEKSSNSQKTRYSMQRGNYLNSGIKLGLS